MAQKYNHKTIEKKWLKRWLEDGVYEPDLENPRNKGKFYNLMMFPYPSAEGLHVGNMYAFTGSDIYGRYQRMKGHDVFEPMGLDGFGIHSENYAIKIGSHPMELSQKSEKRFYEQLRAIGNGFAWDEKVETYDPEYYKWTQWLFIQMFKHGLAYRKKAAVNWCPSCKTVLADEQVIAGPPSPEASVGRGKCERCGTEVIKKELEQWFFKITDYAERLLKNLEKIDWSERVKTAQKNWIGKSEGALIKFKIKVTEQHSNILENVGMSDNFKIEIFTTRPDTLFGVTYLVLAPEHEFISKLKNQNEKLQCKIENWREVEKYIEMAKKKTANERIAEGKDKTGVELKGIKAINPANNEEIPVWAADYVVLGYGTGAIMAVPAHDERDAEFAKKFNLPVGNAPLVDADEITKKVSGEKKTIYHLRDWLISRQRYWGPPIPMIHCPGCGWQPEKEENLPVLLPFVKDFRPTGTEKSPLASHDEFYKTACPKCGGEARRETDVSDTFLDSAWYHLGYLILGNQKSKIKNQNFGLPSNLIKTWLPVDMYIGGAEHSVLHLLYTRFVAMALKDWGLIDFEEPFTKFRAHGLLIKEGAKMSKSKGNIINPDDYIEKYGADVLRMYLMFIGPFEQGGDFRDESIMGIVRFLGRFWSLTNGELDPERNSPPQSSSGARLRAGAVSYGMNKKENMPTAIHHAIKKVGEDIENLHYNTAISEMMILLNELEKQETVSQKTMEIFTKLLAPFAPFMAEEIWMGVLKNKKSVHLEEWPSYSGQALKETEVKIAVQFNGKTRGLITAQTDSEEGEVIALAKLEPSLKKYFDSGEIQKVIFVKNRLINFVI